VIVTTQRDWNACALGLQYARVSRHLAIEVVGRADDAGKQQSHADALPTTPHSTNCGGILISLAAQPTDSILLRAQCVCSYLRRQFRHAISSMSGAGKTAETRRMTRLFIKSFSNLISHPRI
jgi:hypothetical protein